ncbi:alpha-1,4-glucan--maltose-1-phosphate maltosyltransferase [Bifidobacterium sp. ESL0682]|uniref:alpha-1,4-glucan--maltose-1-phosphate maltosyltransferase n=1 Tax=Bifidobacterium sp. ESL0682 TaxID=2983212 RepID=UPI0023F65FBD|nr:alpha-1,4-glucan--maltose-1-phosphate maltosyltransferase [Bifidobacterium sp. ESL0682]WEV42183.1 alpha-1,4-glucan--maltose-1-phosphate maltosyltransferase [Bifidobacterium sp. ESL0682]
MAANTIKQKFSEPATPSIPVSAPHQFGRVVIMSITPSTEHGIFPARIELGETFTVTAQIFIEGRSHTGATAILRDPHGEIRQRIPMTCINPGLDLWKAELTAGHSSNIKPWNKDFAVIQRQLGEWTVTLEGWEDVYASWLSDARIKVEVNDDAENALISGSQLLARWAEHEDAKLDETGRDTLRKASQQLADNTLNTKERLAAADNPAIAELHHSNPLRDGLTLSAPQRFKVERPGSSFTAWYQFFPRSEGATRDPQTGEITQGTLKTSLSGLDRAKAEGFDVVYLPPIFPIGVTNRKGRNNALVAGPDDPGSPFGIGSSLGGHDTVDPLLGTMDDFKAFCAHAHKLGLEIALDFALQCSPDHPWVKEHPNWFRHKPDGTIAFAENPPKKYQDIYPIDFNIDMPGIERETERIMDLWIEAGVTIFRIDNPHTKPVRFWQDVIEAVQRKHPEILFLAEAFTRPAIMRSLSLAGFTQSHSYFPWRNTKDEVTEYLQTTNSDEAYYQHNTFWPTTPDILTDYLRDNGPEGHKVRAVLAAMGSPSWGIYNGYELVENRQQEGREEQADNEKYEIKVRDWNEAEEYGIATLLADLNHIRRDHPACRSYHDLVMLWTSDPNVVAFARHIPADSCIEFVPKDSGKIDGDSDNANDNAQSKNTELPDASSNTGAANQTNDATDDMKETTPDDTLIVVVNLDCKAAHTSEVNFDPALLGLPRDHTFDVHDELGGGSFTWSSNNKVTLDPIERPAYIFSIAGVTSE